MLGMSGSGATPMASVSATSISFSSQVLNTTSVAQAETLTNTGMVNVVLSDVTFTGADASDFAEGADTCTGATLTPSSTCTVSLTFTPSATGNRSATLNFTDNGAGSPQTSNLAGIGSTQLAGVFTNRYDNARSGLNNQETILTPSNVTVGQFGRLFVLAVDGQVYSQPLYMQNVSIPSQGTHNVVFVATQHDSVYAFDADAPTASPLWQVSFLDSSSGVTTVPCADVYGTGAGDCDISPEIGITSTPVIDPVGGTLYVTAKTREPLGTPSCTANGSYDYCYRLHALDVTTGAEKLGGPVVITGSVPGTSPVDSVNGIVPFGAFRHLQRPGLLLLNGLLYIGFGSHGDVDPYHGWLMAYDATNLQQTAIFNVTPDGTEGAIWQGGGGVSADESGYIYVVTANGDFNANTGGIDYSDSVLKNASSIRAIPNPDYFIPFDQATLAEDDLDLGSSQALILPDQPGSNPHLLATGERMAASGYSIATIWDISRPTMRGPYKSFPASATYSLAESPTITVIFTSRSLGTSFFSSPCSMAWRRPRSSLPFKGVDTLILIPRFHRTEPPMESCGSFKPPTTEGEGLRPFVHLTRAMPPTKFTTATRRPMEPIGRARR